MWQQDMNTPEQVAKGFADSAVRFAAAFVAHVESTNVDGDSLREHWRLEACAAVWAAFTATFRASHFSREQQAVMLPMVMQHMSPYWAKLLGSEPGVMQTLTARSEHYLHTAEPGDIAQQASSIVDALLQAAGTATPPEPGTSRVLSHSLSHRMLADLARLDAVNGPNSSVGLTSGPNRIRLGQTVVTRTLQRP